MVEAGLIFLADKKQRKGAYEKRPGQEIEPRQTPTDLVPPAFYRFPTMPSLHASIRALVRHSVRAV